MHVSLLKKHNTQKRSILSLDTLCAFLLLCAAQPYFVWGLHIHNYLLYPCILFYAIKYFKLKNAGLLLIITLLSFYCAIQESQIGLYLNYFSIPLLYIINKQRCALIFERMTLIFSFLVGLSVFFYLLFLLAPSMLPSYQLPSPNPGKSFNYLAYPFFVVPNTGDFFRFHGLFDEAGANGSVTALFLFLNKYDLKKKNNLILFLNGVLSFSFFFIVTSLFYFLLKQFKCSIKNILFVTLAYIAGLILYNETKDNEMISFFVWNRMEISDEGELKGDNRSDKIFDDAYQRFIESPDVLLGRGAGSAAKVASDTSSYKMLIFDYGIIWFLFFLFFWIAILHVDNKNVDKGFLALLFIFLAMIYQRPGILNPFFSFAFMNTGAYQIMNSKFDKKK